MTDAALETARSFARAIERNDLAAARELLAPDCVYVSPKDGKKFDGPAAVIAFHDACKKSLARELNDMTCTSEIAGDGLRFDITFTHRGRVHGNALDLGWNHVVEVQGGRISRIESPYVTGTSAVEYWNRVWEMEHGERWDDGGASQESENA